MTECIRPVHRLDQPRASNARGAAFLAFNALGMLDLADVPSLLHTAEVHDPNPDTGDHVRAALLRHASLHPLL